MRRHSLVRAEAVDAALEVLAPVARRPDPLPRRVKHLKVDVLNACARGHACANAVRAPSASTSHGAAAAWHPEHGVRCGGGLLARTGLLGERQEAREHGVGVGRGGHGHEERGGRREAPRNQVPARARACRVCTWSSAEGEAPAWVWCLTPALRAHDSRAVLALGGPARLGQHHAHAQGRLQPQHPAHERRGASHMHVRLASGAQTRAQKAEQSTQSACARTC